MDEISKKYLHGEYEECMALVVTKLSSISRYYSQSTTSKVCPRYIHKCNRDKLCTCVPLLLYLITLIEKLEPKPTSSLALREKIEQLYVFEASLRVPFPALLAWI
jgi:hypothetical protein